MYDVIVVGAGAAGLMTAITAARQGVKVLLLDGQSKIGAKILMSGGTRCNVTNVKVSEKDFNSQSMMRVRNVLRGFDNKQVIQFFKDIGVELVLEPTGKYFPVTHSGKTVLDALQKAATAAGVTTKTGHKVIALRHADGMFTVQGEGFSLQAKSVVLTTGGLSYPTTGSDGTGYRLAQAFGHGMHSTMPALTPLTTPDADFKKLSGIALPVSLDLYVNNKKERTVVGDFLFTHIGFSGPSALDISRHWLAVEDHQPKIYANFCPTETEQTFEAMVQHARTTTPKKTIKNFIQQFLPQRLAEVLMSKIGLAGEVAFHQMTKDAQKKLTAVCVHYPLAINGAVGYSKAEATAGGIDLNDVNPKTLESIHQPGLYFAGEILDVDGRIGGFNFQWAWASGYLVGVALAKNKAFV